MQKLKWNYPTTMWVGNNRVQDLNLACKSLSIKKPLLVTDYDLVKLDIVQNILKDLKNKNSSHGALTSKSLTKLIKFIGKKELFIFPLNLIMNYLGGIPVNRNSNTNTVDQISDIFNRRKKFKFVSKTY